MGMKSATKIPRRLNKNIDFFLYINSVFYT